MPGHAFVCRKDRRDGKSGDGVNSTAEVRRELCKSTHVYASVQCPADLDVCINWNLAVAGLQAFFCCWFGLLHGRVYVHVHSVHMQLFSLSQFLVVL